MYNYKTYFYTTLVFAMIFICCAVYASFKNKCLHIENEISKAQLDECRKAYKGMCYGNFNSEYEVEGVEDE